MATISEKDEPQEESESDNPLHQDQHHPQLVSHHPNKLLSRAFSFWAYFTLLVALLTILFSSLPSPHPPDLRSRFLSFPPDLRRHHSLGRHIKAFYGPSRRQLEIFTVDFGPRDSSETVLLLHGLAGSSFSFRHVSRHLSSASIRSVAVDLPGAGFSDHFPAAGKWGGGVFGTIRDVYTRIKEKGIFWGFDQIVEYGGVPYEEVAPPAASKPNGYEMAELGAVVGQVIEAMGLAPVHLVLHDSIAVAGAANWISSYPMVVRSITFIDSSMESTVFPSGILGVPILGNLLLKSSFAFRGLLKLCCSRTIDGSAVEAYRLLLKDGKGGVVAAGRALNLSFDLGEWAADDAVKGIPVQVLWSGAWSDLWIELGRKVASALPHAKFRYHSGGRWPQEDAADEIAGMISQFVSSLPKTVKPNVEEPVSEGVQRIFDESSGSINHGNHHHHHHGHAHPEAAGFLNTYGLDHLDHEWGS